MNNVMIGAVKMHNKKISLPKSEKTFVKKVRTRSRILWHYFNLLARDAASSRNNLQHNLNMFR
jgi:hypothetical protein